MYNESLESYTHFVTLRSGNLLALLNRINSSKRNTCLRDFFPPLPSDTKNSFCLNSLPCSLRLTSQSRIESIAKRSFPCRSWNRTMSSAAMRSSRSATILSEAPSGNAGQAFISCCRRRAYLPILWTGFNR